MGTTVHVSGKRHFGDFDGGSASIKINEDGKVLIICGEGEIGQGTMTVLCQIAAEELGVPFEDVSISKADTDLTTYCHGAYASRLTYIAGNAVRDAAVKVKKQLFETAAELLEASVEELEIANGRVFVRGGSQRPDRLRRRRSPGRASTGRAASRSSAAAASTPTPSSRTRTGTATSPARTTSASRWPRSRSTPRPGR